jgi:hypothetical protein
MRILNTNDDYKFDVDLSQLDCIVDEENLFHKKEESSFKSLNKLITCSDSKLSFGNDIGINDL